MIRIQLDSAFLSLWFNFRLIQRFSDLRLCHDFTVKMRGHEIFWLKFYLAVSGGLNLRICFSSEIFAFCRF